jgi:hypothetical protein
MTQDFSNDASAAGRSRCPCPIRPLIYQRTDKGYLLYSVGSNLTGDSRKKLDGRNTADDVAVRYTMNEP